MSGKYWIPVLVVVVAACTLAFQRGVESAPEVAPGATAATKAGDASAGDSKAGAAKAAEADNATGKAGAENVDGAAAVPAKVYPALLPGMGAVRGKVRLVGKPPLPDVLTVPKNNRDHAACSPHVKSERLVLGSGQEIRDVFVSIADYKPKQRPAPRTVVLDNSQCNFKPHAIAATRGSTLEITSSDPFLHNSHGMLTENFNVAIIKGAPNKRKLRKAGWTVIKCDIHPWMQAQLHVFDHDLFDVSSAAGEYRIVNVPPGEYELEVWHEKVAFAFGTNPKKRVGKITVVAGETVELNIELKAPAP